LTTRALEGTLSRMARDTQEPDRKRSRPSSAVGESFIQHQVALKRFIARFFARMQDIDDVAKESFLRAVDAQSAGTPIRSPKAFLFRIARNVRADHFRKHGAAVYVPEEDMDWATDAPGPAHILERARDMARLKRALQALRDDRRELIVMVRYQGMTHEQVGAVLGVDAGTVKVRFHRALKELRDAFTRVPEGD